MIMSGESQDMMDPVETEWKYQAWELVLMVSAAFAECAFEESVVFLVTMTEHRCSRSARCIYNSTRATKHRREFEDLKKVGKRGGV